MDKYQYLLTTFTYRGVQQYEYEQLSIAYEVA